MTRNGISRNQTEHWSAGVVGIGVLECWTGGGVERPGLAPGGVSLSDHLKKRLNGRGNLPILL